VVASDIPASYFTMVTPCKMRQCAMHRIVREHELRLCQRQMLNKLRVVVEKSRVGAGGPHATLACAGFEFEVHHQRAQKGLFQN
jgi:hypothetical protein